MKLSQSLAWCPRCASLNIHKPVKMAIMSDPRKQVRITSFWMGDGRKCSVCACACVFPLSVLNHKGSAATLPWHWLPRPRASGKRWASFSATGRLSGSADRRSRSMCVCVCWFYTPPGLGMMGVPGGPPPPGGPWERQARTHTAFIFRNAL